MNNTTTPVFPRMGNAKQAVELSGLSERHIRALVAENKVAHVWAGRRLLINLDSLALYLQTGDGLRPRPTVNGVRRLDP